MIQDIDFGYEISAHYMLIKNYLHIHYMLITTLIKKFYKKHLYCLTIVHYRET